MAPRGGVAVELSDLLVAVARVEVRRLEGVRLQRDLGAAVSAGG